MNAQAAQKDNQCLRVLLQLGADPTLLGSNKNTALHSAVYYDNHEAIPLLVQAGCSVEAEGLHMQTPLHVACMFGHVQCVEKLLNAGADPHRVDPGTNQTNFTFALCECEEKNKRALVSFNL
jgi:ankyrin repeat protein